MNAPAAIEQVTPATTRRRLPRAAFPAGAALLLALAGTAWVRSPGVTESTDNAYVHADSTLVSARVGGTVVRVLVRDNQEVRAGSPLLQIDPEEYDARIDAAKAVVADAAAGVASARAALTSFAADQQVALADVAVAETTIPSAAAEQRRAAADDARYSTLLKSGFVTRSDAERIAAAAIGARAQYRRSVTAYQATRDRASATTSRKDALLADQGKADASLAKAKAALVLAEQDRGYTFIRAAVSGSIGNRQVHVGDLVKPGSQLLTIVPNAGLYVVANFKETQTRRMMVGQPASMTIDALDGHAVNGRVESFAPASGSDFALLPLERGSGNFTKIVQRIPVRIALEASPSELAHLRAGLSTTATVRVKQ